LTGERIYRRERHTLTDTNAFCLWSTFIPPDYRGAVRLPERLRRRCPPFFADRTYYGILLQLMLRRWVVERTFAWFDRCCHLAQNFGGSAASESPASSLPISGC
jgi:hypothetical protein